MQGVLFFVTKIFSTKKPRKLIRGFKRASQKVQISNSFYEDLKKIFDLEAFVPVDYIDFNRLKTCHSG